MPTLWPIWRIAHWHLQRPNARHLFMSNGEWFSFLQSEGGPQGDPLMPLLFSVLISVLLKAVIDKHRVACAAAYLDDTTTVAKVQTQELVYDDMVAMAPTLCGFSINGAKTVVLSVSPSPSAAVLRFVAKHQLEFHHGSSVVVGGTVGLNKSQMSSWIVKKAQSHSGLFRLLSHPEMPPGFAMQMLRQLAMPVFTHLLRAHEPTVTEAGAKLLDRATTLAYCAINSVPELLLPENHLKLAELRLPVRLGGEGLPSLQFTASLASYAALAAAVAQNDPYMQQRPPRHPPELDPADDDVVDDAAMPHATPATSSATHAHGQALPSQPPPSLSVPLPNPRDYPAAPTATPPSAATASLQARFHAFLAFARQHCPALIADKIIPASYTQFLNDYASAKCTASRLQHLLSQSLYKELAKRLFDAPAQDAADRARLTSLRVHNPLPKFDLSDPAQRFTPDEYRLIVRHMRGLQPAPLLAGNTTARCGGCNQLLHRDSQHFSSCDAYQAEVIARHNKSYQALAQLASACGVGVVTEEALPCGKRVDLTLQLPQDATRFMCDFSVANATSLSNRYGKAQTEALHAEHARATAKHKKYDNDVAAQGATFVPLIMGVHGAVTPAFARMVSRLHQAATLTGHANPPSKRRILATVVATMLKHHAQILAAGNKRIINSPPPKQ
jgi:hypothetical protein